MPLIARLSLGPFTKPLNRINYYEIIGFAKGNEIKKYYVTLVKMDFQPN
jgi:hypothetical protein